MHGMYNLSKLVLLHTRIGGALSDNYNVLPGRLARSDFLRPASTQKAAIFAH